MLQMLRCQAKLYLVTRSKLTETRYDYLPSLGLGIEAP